jgi:hypothetical protein
MVSWLFVFGLCAISNDHHEGETMSDTSTEKFTETLRVLDEIAKELCLRGDATTEDKMPWTQEAAATLVLAATIHRSTLRIEAALNCIAARI